MARRHYRVAKKQAEQKANYAKGTFIPDTQKPKVYAVTVCIAIFLYLSGLLLGFIAGKQE